MLVYGTYLLVVVGVASAVRAVVAVDGLARVTVVGVGVELALGDLQVGARDDLVERVCTTAQKLAGVTVAAKLVSIVLTGEGEKVRAQSYQRMCDCSGMVASH